MRKGPIVLEDCNGILYVHSSYRAQLYSAGAKAYLIMKEMMALVVLRPKMTFFNRIYNCAYNKRSSSKDVVIIYTPLYNFKTVFVKTKMKCNISLLFK